MKIHPTTKIKRTDSLVLWKGESISTTGRNAATTHTMKAVKTALPVHRNHHSRARNVQSVGLAAEETRRGSLHWVTGTKITAACTTNTSDNAKKISLFIYSGKKNHIGNMEYRWRMFL